MKVRTFVVTVVDDIHVALEALDCRVQELGDDIDIISIEDALYPRWPSYPGKGHDMSVARRIVYR